jgi:hypothetical protein
VLVSSMKTQARKYLILFDTTNGIIVFKKHVFSSYVFILFKNCKSVWKRGE